MIKWRKHTLEIIEVMSYGHKYWDQTIGFAAQCSWSAGPVLAQMMKNREFEKNERVLAAICDGQIAGFCTFSNKDEMPKEYAFTPFIGFMFVDEAFRGNRLSERLIHAACEEAKRQGFLEIYLMSGEIGLYEKYGFQKIGDYKTIYDTYDQLFWKSI